LRGGRGREAEDREEAKATGACVGRCAGRPQELCRYCKGSAMDRQAANQDWAGLADWVRENLSEAQRGALRRAGRLGGFGDEGYSPRGVGREVELRRGWLEARGYAVEGPDTDAAGCTWAMVAAPPAGAPAVTEPVEHALWECYAEA